MKTIFKITFTICALATTILSCSKDDSKPTTSPSTTSTTIAKDLVTVTTLAGSTSGFLNGQGDAAQFKGPVGIAIGPNGNFYVTDYDDGKIRNITPQGLTTTFQESTLLEIAGNTPKFNKPYGIYVTPGGNVITADSGSHRIKISGVDGNSIVTLAGSTAGDSFSGSFLTAKFNLPYGLAANAVGVKYLLDSGNNRIKILNEEAGTVDAFVGLDAGNAIGSAANARFRVPSGIVIDKATGNLYVSDTGNHTIKMITPVGVTSVIAGTGSAGDVVGAGNISQFNEPVGLVLDANKNIYVCDTGNNKIKKITPAGVVSVVAGTTVGDVNGSEKVAKFNYPIGIAIDAAGNLIVCDTKNHKVKKITFN